jgi:serine/threonine protein kinase
LTNYWKGFSAEGFVSLEQELKRSYFDDYEIGTLQLNEEDIEMLGRYLRKMLFVDPKQRATSQELLVEAWVSGPKAADSTVSE